MNCCSTSRVVIFPASINAKVWFDAERKTIPMEVSRQQDNFCIEVCVECGCINSFFTGDEMLTLLQAAGDPQ